MNLQEFITSAIRTESRVETINVNIRFVEALIEAIICLGTILDQFKKNVFYNKPFDIPTILNLITDARIAITTLTRIINTDTLNIKGTADVNPRIFHAVLGITTEAVELLEGLDLRNNFVDRINILEEFGDLDWYKAIGIDELNGDWEQLLITITEKLRTRYPDKFTSEHAIERNIENERKVLDNKLGK